MSQQPPTIPEQIDAALEQTKALMIALVAPVEAQRRAEAEAHAETSEALRLSKNEVQRQRGLLAAERRAVASRDAEIAQLKAQLKPPRYPQSFVFDGGKLPPLTKAAYAQVLAWDESSDPKKQPSFAGIVKLDRVHMKHFREINMEVGAARAMALVGDPAPVLKMARLTMALIQKTHKGYGPLKGTEKLGPNVPLGWEQKGVRRFNIWDYDSKWQNDSATDWMNLDRCLEYGTLAGLLELLEGCANAHPEIAKAAAALRELLCVDLAVRVKGIALSRGAKGLLHNTLSNLHHPAKAFSYACRVIGERLDADPELLARARALGKTASVPDLNAEEFLEAYEVIGGWLKAEEDVVKAPNGEECVVFPHGVQALRPAHNKLDVFHFTVYMAETVTHEMADHLTGGKYAPREHLERLGNTVMNCVFVDGFGPGLLSDDIGGGGLQDAAEEKKGGPAFREVRFRGGGKAPSRWHLSDRDTGYGDSRTTHATTGRGMATSAMAFSDAPGRLDAVNAADKAQAQDWRVGYDVARLLIAATSEGVVRL